MSPRTVHKTLLAAIIVAGKMHEDSFRVKPKVLT